MAPTPALIIGNKNTAATSLSAWLCLRKAKVEFVERVLDSDAPDAAEVAAEWSPSGHLPVLVYEGVPVWDALAIAETVNEQIAGNGLWPAAIAERAAARSLANEVHAGFQEVARALPMHCRTQELQFIETPALAKEIVRVAGAWRHALSRSGGPWLFRSFSIADALFAPFVLRFRAHSVRLGDVEQAYMRHVLSDPDVLAWFSAALAAKA